jgi:hypothetical protein
VILSQALPVLASVVAANLAHQRITIAPVPGGMRLSARADTGLAIAIMVDAAAPSLGAIEVGVKALAECVSKMGAVTLATEKGALVVSAGKSKVRIPMVDGASEDVAAADGVACEVDREALATALSRAVLAACPDATRPHVHGIIADGEGNVVASDGHRLHLSRCEGLPVLWTIPLASVRTIIQALESSEGVATVTGGAFNGGRATVASFEVGRTMIRTPLIGEHPLPWRQVLPKLRGQGAGQGERASLRGRAQDRADEPYGGRVRPQQGRAWDHPRGRARRAAHDIRRRHDRVRVPVRWIARARVGGGVLPRRCRELARR